MPFIRVIVPAKRTEASSKALIEKITEAVHMAGCGPIENVRIVVQQSDEVATAPVGPLNGFAHVPVIEMFLIEGRSLELKRLLEAKLGAAVRSAGLGAHGDPVVFVREVPSTAWGIAGKTARDLGR
ncbi:MAG: tautomerase family protein [Acidobacteriota bacterium]|nr:tautomerase family protein [Acidobacteriota bacterium]